jgi:uncharacterized protein YbjT (DUF2867 family)
LADTHITGITSLVRRPSGQAHAKLTEVVITDFTDYTAHADVFEQIDAAFFCIGAYTGQLPDAQFKALTVDYAVAFGKQLQMGSPQARLCLLSGAGADRSVKSRTAFARYKGMAENQLSALDLEFYSFRPGYIFPVRPRKEPNLMYKISRGLYPLIKMFGKKYSIPSTHLAQTMLTVGLNGHSQEILENIDIADLTGG